MQQRHRLARPLIRTRRKGKRLGIIGQERIAGNGVRGKARNGRRLRLHQRHAQTLTQRGEDKHIERLQNLGHVVAHAQEIDRRGNAQAFRLLLQLAFLLATSNHKKARFGNLTQNAREHIKQKALVLLCHEPAHVSDKRHIGIAQGLLRAGVGGGIVLVARKINTVAHHVEALGRGNANAETIDARLQAASQKRVGDLRQVAHEIPV